MSDPEAMQQFAHLNEVVALQMEIDDLEAEIERLRALLHELADDLESELLGRYKTLEGKMRPIEQRRFERDMDSVRRARRALERRKG